jgi:hypothetical protein
MQVRNIPFCWEGETLMAMRRRRSVVVSSVADCVPVWSFILTARRTLPRHFPFIAFLWHTLSPLAVNDLNLLLSTICCWDFIQVHCQEGVFLDFYSSKWVKNDEAEFLGQVVVLINDKFNYDDPVALVTKILCFHANERLIDLHKIPAFINDYQHKK